MNAQQYAAIATSNNPFIETCFGLTMLFLDRNGKIWIEYINEWGFTSQEKVTSMRLNEYQK